MTLITAKAVAPLPVASVRDFLVGRGSTKPFPQRAFVLVRLGGEVFKSKDAVVDVGLSVAQGRSTAAKSPRQELLHLTYCARHA